MKLLITYYEATRAYADSLYELQRCVGVLPRTEFNKLYALMKEARRKTATAMLAFEAHITDHRC